MKDEIVNGLSLKNDIALFYNFLAKYDEIVQSFNYQTHQKSFFNIINKKSITHKKTSETNDILEKEKTIGDNSIMMIKKSAENIPLALIRHLRNSIAHGQISHKRNRYVICDKVKFGKKSKYYGLEYPTAYGIYDKDKIVDLINFLLSIISEQKCQQTKK